MHISCSAVAHAHAKKTPVAHYTMTPTYIFSSNDGLFKQFWVLKYLRRHLISYLEFSAIDHRKVLGLKVSQSLFRHVCPRSSYTECSPYLSGPHVLTEGGGFKGQRTKLQCSRNGDFKQNTSPHWTYFLLMKILARSASTHQRKHTNMAIKWWTANHGRISRAPRHIKTPLSCCWQLIHDL